ncbi:MAG TPA: DUF2243 domain-containing protein [Acetobacteraceae bacterium]|nr:DUF2243 domain-containing protein [Acetobacteraceae bacterium]
MTHDAARPTRGLLLAGGVVGFALGGFFDGILLHQVLQWHHFLSLVPGEALRDIRTQILADGMFHVVVYAIAVVGLSLLWSARSGFAESGADRRLLGAALLGFAAWQAADVGIFHWTIGIHRIRVDVPNPLAWDIGWLVVIGAPPLFLGLILFRRGGAGGRGAVVASVLALFVLGAAPVASLPPAGVMTALVLFRPGMGLEGAFAAVAAANGRIAWADASGELAVVDMREASIWRIYRGGAMLVGTTAAGGCLAWTRMGRGA